MIVLAFWQCHVSQSQLFCMKVSKNINISQQAYILNQRVIILDFNMISFEMSVMGLARDVI